MKRNRPAFPISTQSRDKDGVVFDHEIVGGLSIRDYMAIEFMKGLLSNAALIANGGTVEKIRAIAIREADALIAMLGEE